MNLWYLILNDFIFLRNAEDTKRDDNEMQSSSHHVLTLDGEVVAVNGKLLAGHGNIRGVLDEDQTSVNRVFKIMI